MRVELQNGRYVVCGYMFPDEQILPGETWQGSGGSTVTVDRVSGGWVEYSWVTNDTIHSHSKSCFAFQCRYCKVVDENFTLSTG